MSLKSQLAQRCGEYHRANVSQITISTTMYRLSWRYCQPNFK